MPQGDDVPQVDVAPPAFGAACSPACAHAPPLFRFHWLAQTLRRPCARKLEKLDMRQLWPLPLPLPCSCAVGCTGAALEERLLRVVMCREGMLRQQWQSEVRRLVCQSAAPACCACSGGLAVIRPA